jgi:hypothetical protein
MSKIPKNLTDKDMLKNWVEEETVEDKFLRAEKIEDKKRRERAGIEPPAELACAGLTRQLTEELGKALTELKMQLTLKGAKDITYKVKNDGTKIVIAPKYTL